MRLECVVLMHGHSFERICMTLLLACGILIPSGWLWAG